MTLEAKDWRRGPSLRLSRENSSKSPPRNLRKSVIVRRKKNRRGKRRKEDVTRPRRNVSKVPIAVVLQAPVQKDNSKCRPVVTSLSQLGAWVVVAVVAVVDLFPLGKERCGILMRICNHISQRSALHLDLN